MPTQIGSTVTDFDAATPTSLTTSYTQAAGTNRVLVVQVATEGDVAVSGVTFDGVALTQEIFEAGSGRRSSLWYLINPTVTTANIVVSLASSADVGMIASSWEDTHQTTPFRASAGANGTGNPSVAVSSAVGDLVIDSFDQDDTSTGTPGSGQTQLAQFEVTDDFQMGSSTEAGAAGSVTMDWTGFGADDFTQVAGSLQPPVSATPPTVDAGGPYNGDVDVATALNATVTPGTDPTPVLLWTIFSGPGGGVFSNDAIEDPTFTPDTVGAYVLQLSADPDDGPPVLDTATFESDDVPPVVDAGGPYNGDVDVATALNATVTPGSDPAPVLLWTIDAGPGSGVFLPSAAVEDPTFTPDTVGSYTLRLTATPSDGPAVFDTASFESDDVPPVVDAGGPYNGDVSTAIALDATVTPGSDPTPVLLWTIDSGPGGGVFSSDSIEDPTFTPDTVGSYVLRLTATPSDGPAVFDTANLESDAPFVAPTVDAGGPYSGDFSVATALDATVTPGSDPTPTLLWTITSDPPLPGSGSFSNDAIEDPTFTPFNVGDYVLRLTVTPSDGPAVFDEADFESLAVAPIVDAGGPYSGDPGQPTQLDGTVTPGSTTDITTKWTIDSGGTGSFSDDSVLDPLFTPDDVGNYVLRLTATAADGPTPFDTATFNAGALADAQILNGRLIRGGTEELVLSQLALGADPPPDSHFIKGTAVANTGEMFVAIDDGVVARVFIAGIAHQHNGVRLVTLSPPQFFVGAWGIDGNGAQSVGGTGTGHANEGVKVTNDGFTVVDGVTPIPPVPTAFPQPASVIHDFDFTDKSQVIAGPSFNFPIADNGAITRVLNKGSDGTSLDYSGVASESPFWIENPTGPEGIIGAARFVSLNNTELFKNIATNYGENLTVAMIFKGMDEPPPGSILMHWGNTSGGTNAFGVQYRAPVNDTGSTILRGQTVAADAAFGQLNSFNWYMLVGSIDSSGNFVCQRTGATAFTGVLVSGSGPGPNAVLKLGDRPDDARQFDGDIARTWVWDVALSASEVQQMLDWGDENYGPFSYNGVPTLPGIQNDFLDSISIPFSQSNDIEGVTPDLMVIDGSNFDNAGIYAGATIEQNAILSQNVDLTGKYLIEKTYSDVGFHDTVILDRNIPGAFGPYLGVAFDLPHNFVLNLLYDSTADEGLLALALTLSWASTLISLPTDGVSSWEAYGVEQGDVLRFENSVNHPDLDFQCVGFQGVQGGGHRDLQVPFGSTINRPLPYLGADVSDVRLIKRATK